MNLFILVYFYRLIVLNFRCKDKQNNSTLYQNGRCILGRKFVNYRFNWLTDKTMRKMKMQRSLLHFSCFLLGTY